MPFVSGERDCTDIAHVLRKIDLPQYIEIFEKNMVGIYIYFKVQYTCMCIYSLNWGRRRNFVRGSNVMHGEK